MTAKARSSFKSDQAASFADNTSGNITAGHLRSEMNNIADSAVFPEDVATTSVPGVMSASDKTKLNGIATGANNYTHPNHTGDVTSSGDGATTIANSVVTYAKMQNASAGYTIMVKATTGAGAYAELAAGTDGVLRRSGSGNLAFGSLVAGNFADNTIALSRLANQATETVVGRVAGGSGAPSALSKAQLTTLVNTFTTTLSGAVPAASGGNTTTEYLRKDGTWAAPAGGGGGITEIVAGTGIAVDDTNPAAPVVSIDAGASLAEKSTLVDADKFPMFDSAASDAVKYATRATLRTGLVPTSLTLTAGTGIATIGDLSANRTIALSAGAQASLALADTSVQPARSISTGTGLTGGGNLSANRTIALDSGSIASLAKADTSVQSVTTGVTGADAITNAMSLTTAEYAAIGSKNASTLYIITDAP